MDKDTIYSDSNIGKRLSNIHKSEIFKISYNGKQLPMATEIRIGRNPDNNIVVDDSLASRYHAVIQKIKEEYFLKDLSSSNGTKVNGEVVPSGKYVKLHQSDTITVGRTDLKVL